LDSQTFEVFGEVVFSVETPSKVTVSLPKKPSRDLEGLVTGISNRL